MPVCLPACLIDCLAVCLLSACPNPAKHAKGVASADSNAASTNKPRRRNNPIPRPDLIQIDVPLQRDTRYLKNGYEYIDKDQYVIDRANVQAALQEARLIIAFKVFDTDDVSHPTTSLKRFWSKSGMDKTKPLQEVVAILLNAASNGLSSLNIFGHSQPRSATPPITRGSFQSRRPRSKLRQ